MRATGAELTILRSTWLMENLGAEYVLEHVLSGGSRAARRGRAHAFLDVDDIAEIAVAALTDERHIGLCTS